MKLVPLLLLLPMVIQGYGELELDNKKFLIYNSVYRDAKIAMFGKGEHLVGTYDEEINPDQVWKLVPSGKKDFKYGDCHYIVNTYYPEWRIADLDHKFRVQKGPYKDYQLFYFNTPGWMEDMKELTYEIESCHYFHERMGKWGSGDYDVNMWDGAGANDQYWRLIPQD
jgi:hypothetical protein